MLQALPNVTVLWLIYGCAGPGLPCQSVSLCPVQLPAVSSSTEIYGCLRLGSNTGFAVQAEIDSMQKQMAAVTLDKQDLQQASQLQEQLRKAIHDQQQLSTSLQGEWQKQEQKLSTRYSISYCVRHQPWCLAACCQH